MQTLEAIKLGFLGLGWPGEQHAKAAVAVPSGSVYAACDVGAERRESFAAQFSPARMYSRYEDMLSDPQVEAIVVSLPNFLHASATMSALRAGKHVLCEKPPTMNVAEMEAIRTEATAHGLVYAFSRQSRFNNKMLAAKRLVEEEMLGRIYFARAERVRSRGIPVGVGGWFTEKSKAGGGAMIDIGVHAIDAAWYLAGCPEPLSVSAQVSANFRGQVPVGVTFDVEDSGFAMLRFAGGLVMHLEVTWAGNLTDAVPKSPWAGHELENTTLYGDQATLSLNPTVLYTMQEKERKTIAIQTGPETNGFDNQMTDFLQAVRTGGKPVNNADQAVALMKMLMAIYESSDTGAEVRLAG